MRVALAVLFMLAVSFPASAQGPSLTFSDVPAGIPDFSQWVTRDSRHSFGVTDAQRGPLEQAAIRHGLCRAHYLPCTIDLRVSFSLLFRCIDGEDREADCRRRMAFKSKKVVAVVGRYVMERGGAQAEGFVLETDIDPDPDPDNLYFVRTPAAAQWKELPADGTAADARTVQEDLFTFLTLLSKKEYRP